LSDENEEKISIKEAQELLPLLPPYEQEAIEREIAKITEKEIGQILRITAKVNNPKTTPSSKNQLRKNRPKKITFDRAKTQIVVIDREIQEKFPSLTSIGGQLGLKKNKKHYEGYEIV
jgi:hypothetical protein